MVTVAPREGAGALIGDVDITDVSDDEFAVIERAFADYGVIFFGIGFGRVLG